MVLKGKIKFMIGCSKEWKSIRVHFLVLFGVPLIWSQNTSFRLKKKNKATRRVGEQFKGPPWCEESPHAAIGSLIQPVVEKFSPSFNLLIVKKTIFSLSTCSIFTIATVTSLSTNDTSLSVIRARRDTHTLSHAIATWRVCREKTIRLLIYIKYMNNYSFLRIRRQSPSITCAI